MAAPSPIKSLRASLCVLVTLLAGAQTADYKQPYVRRCTSLHASIGLTISINSIPWGDQWGQLSWEHAVSRPASLATSFPSLFQRRTGKWSSLGVLWWTVRTPEASALPEKSAWVRFIQVIEVHPMRHARPRTLRTALMKGGRGSGMRETPCSISIWLTSATPASAGMKGKVIGGWQFRYTWSTRFV